MEEDVVVGDEGEGEEHARRLIEAGRHASGAPCPIPGDQDPRRNARGGELDCDPRAYRMLHRLGPDWPCLSFDFVRDAGGGGRHAVPCRAAARARAARGHATRTGSALLKPEGLGRLRRTPTRTSPTTTATTTTTGTRTRGTTTSPSGTRARQPRGGLRAGAGARGDVVRPRRRAGLGRAPECERLCAAARGPRPHTAGRYADRAARGGLRPAVARRRLPRVRRERRQRVRAAPGPERRDPPSTPSGHRRRAPSRTSPGRPRRPRSS